jgi:hypothetical protein
MTNKTLVGKSNYLFLINDASDAYNMHINNIKKCNENSFHRYMNYINKQNILMVVFPDKEVVCKDFLLDNNIIYRPNFNEYKRVFGNMLIDGLDVLDYTDYYITDTHINNKGALKIYKEIVKYLNNNFKTSIPLDNYNTSKNFVVSLSRLDKGIGDLTWDMNKGNIVLNDISDIYYNFENVEDTYLNVYNSENNYLILNYNLEDISNNYIGKRLDWTCLSSNILCIKNTSRLCNKRVIIFYDSFLAHTLNLYKTLFAELYLIKTIFNEELINKIKPDFIIEARVERFLF